MIGTKGLLSKVQSFSQINKIFPEQILLFIVGINFQCLPLKREDVVALLMSGKNQLSKINSKFSSTAYNIFYIHIIRMVSLIECPVFRSPLSSSTQSRESSQKFYSDWMEEVKRSVPEGQLLMYDIRKGWEPLCQFLQVPVPGNQFPRFEHFHIEASSLH